VDATLHDDDHTATVVIEDKHTHESILELGAEDVEWVYLGFTCHCCGMRERRLLVSASSADASSKKFFKKYSMLRAVEAGEDVRKVARMEVALKNGDWMSIGLRCGDEDEQGCFQAFSKAIATASELTVHKQVNCMSQRRKQTHEKNSAAMEGEGGEFTDADRHMQELLNELSLEEMRTPTKSKRKSKKKKTMSALDDIVCSPLDASDAGVVSVTADRTRANTTRLPEASTDDHDMRVLAADADAASIAKSVCDMSTGEDFAEHLVSVETRKIVGGPGDEEVGRSNKVSTDEWETAYSSAKARRKNKRKTDVAAEAPAPVTSQITDSMSCASYDQSCAYSLLATVKAAPAAASDAEEAVVSADGRPSARKELDVGTVVRSNCRCFECRTESTRVPSDAEESDSASPRIRKGTESTRIPSDAEESDSASPRHRKGTESTRIPSDAEESDSASPRHRKGTESTRIPSDAEESDWISYLGSDPGQDAISQAVLPSAPVASPTSSGFSQPCHSTVQKDVCITVPLVLGGVSKEPSQAEGKMQVAKCPWELSAKEASQHNFRENEQCNHLISVDSSDEDSADLGEDSDVSGVASEAQFFAGVNDLHESLSYWVDPNHQLLHFIAPAFVLHESFGFDTLTSEISSLHIPTAPDQFDLPSDGSFPTYSSWSSRLGSPMKVHVAFMPPMRMDHSEPRKVDAHSVCTAESLEQGSVCPTHAERAPTIAPDPSCLFAGSERLRTALEEEIRCTEARLLNLRRRLQQLC